MDEQEKSRCEGTILDDPVVVEPRVSLVEPAMHEAVVFCPVGPMVTLAAKSYRAKKKIKPMHPAAAYEIKRDGQKASLVGPAMGAPAAAYVVERVIAAGARNLVMLGLCGSINPRVRIGDLVVPSAALIEEGVSPHYVAGAAKSYPSESAYAAVCDAVEAADKSCHAGTIWTTDAIFRESEAKVEEYGERGLLAVEMEASALFTIARRRGVDLGAVMVVSDELFELKWKMGFTKPRFLSAMRSACKIALDAAFRM